MKKLFLLAFMSLMTLAQPAMATPTCESWMTDGCTFYTEGLSKVLQINPLSYRPDPVGEPTLYRTNLSQSEMSTIGLQEFVGGYEDVQIQSLPTLLINAIKELDTIIDAQAMEIDDLKDRVDALENPAP